ncbi:MAG: MBL fold metallo-hydrolase [Bacteroidota bacterium]
MRKNFFKQFGGKSTRELEAYYRQSENWREGSFQNIEPTTLGASLLEFPKIIYKQLTNTKGRVPEQSLAVAAFDKSAFLQESDKAKFIWYGHSALLIRISGKTIMIDPMLGPDTTPIAPVPTKRFSENTLDLIDDFPEIDLILITHDHYDHLDFASIQKLKAKAKHFFVAIGVKRHLEAWGVSSASISEFDWWQAQSFHNLNITFTPTRHFSGRGLTDRGKTLWGGWAIQSAQENIWFSGDGGYGDHFKAVGQRLGPFDFAFMECGQYNKDWHLIHLFPEEAIKAALDAGVQKAMPVHWAGFPLSYQHTWQEPANDFQSFATQYQLDYSFPELGKIFQVSTILKAKWWEGLR